MVRTPATLENLPQRFWPHVDRTGDCWIWLGGRGSKGLAYGRFQRVSGENPMGTHRIAYEMCIGPIPEGFHVDHLCCTPLCVNPAHLEAVTAEENRRRQAARVTHCKRGHPFSGENLRITAEGFRLCRTCRRNKRREVPLTAAEIAEIRSRYRLTHPAYKTGASASELAREFRITPQYVGRLVRSGRG